jgi:hypothetical protein
MKRTKGMIERGERKRIGQREYVSGKRQVLLKRKRRLDS